MPLNHNTTRVFTRTLFAGILEKMTLLKRGDDLQQGTVTSLTLFDCRRSLITKRGETIQHDMLNENRTIWHIPRREMDRVGVAFLSPLDRILDQQGRYWQPESGTEISDKLFENEYDIQCLRVDPPDSTQTSTTT